MNAKHIILQIFFHSIKYLRSAFSHMNTKMHECGHWKWLCASQENICEHNFRLRYDQLIVQYHRKAKAIPLSSNSTFVYFVCKITDISNHLIYCVGYPYYATRFIFRGFFSHWEFGITKQMSKKCVCLKTNIAKDLMKSK